MNCDRCGREATIEEVTKVGQTYVYKHLCEACAATEGIGASGSKPAGATVITVQSLSADQPKGGDRSAQECPHCGLTFADFRESGRLGCSSCYDTFQARMGPMIERAQEGGTHHIGKAPRRMLSSIPGEGPARAAAMERLLGETKQRREKLERLSRQLQAALAGERFEQAAMIRDEMRRLREGLVEVQPTDANRQPGAGHGD